MDQMLMRVYQEIDIREVKDHTLIFGDLSASCSGCNALDLKIDTKICPKCQTEFKYISFRNIATHLPKAKSIFGSQSGQKLIDFDDYKKLTGALKAKDFLK